MTNPKNNNNSHENNSAAIELTYRQDQKFILDTIEKFLHPFTIDPRRISHTEPRQRRRQHPCRTFSS
ncbi:protein of unknown function [Burkholderia multivorans]